MRFQKPQRLAKIAFSLPTEYPKEVQEIVIVGSDDCKSDRIGHWTTLLTIKPAFTKGFWEVKSWEIPLQKRVGFTCIGLMWPRGFDGNNRARLSQITMWGHPVDNKGLD